MILVMQKILMYVLASLKIQMPKPFFLHVFHHIYLWRVCEKLLFKKQMHYMLFSIYQIK